MYEHGTGLPAGMEMTGDVIERAAGGDSEAFRTIVDHYRHTVHRAAWRIVGNPDDALDIAQDAFVRLYGALGEGTLTGDPGAWLYRVTVNAAIDHVRRSVHHLRVDLCDAPEEHESGASQPDIVAERRETAGIILTLAAELPDRQAEVFTLRDIEGIPVSEIGVLLGCADNTVRVHLARARLALRSMLKKRYPYLIASGG